MEKREVIKRTAGFIKNKLLNEGSGHDWQHIELVWKNAKKISSTEPKADKFIVELAALLHELGDFKLEKDGKARHGERTAAFLKQFNLVDDIVERVVDIVDNLSFSKNVASKRQLSLEGKIVQDADRLEAMGAIGIARAFTYGGSKGRIIYDPKVKPVKFKSASQYKNNTTPTLNHFYEKLLLLKDLMNTKSGKKLALGRHKFMQNYLQEFFAEWKGQR